MKPLFTLDDITKAEAKNWISVENPPEICCTTLAEIIENLRDNQVICFNSHGKFSLYNIVENILEKLGGQSNIFLTTYGLSEPAVRKLANMKFKEQLLELNCLLDYRIAQRQPKAFKLLSSVADKIGYKESHAKITVIENEHLNITILGSQNWTRNTKHEAGAIICSKPITQFYKDYISSLLC